jgi:carboxypeptidase family protein
MQSEFRESWKNVRRGAAGFRGWRWLTCLVLAATSAFVARAQLSGTGAIAGTVTDSTGAVVSNATVTVTSVETNENTVRTTTGAGDYNVTPLTPGMYTVTVTASGFRTFVQENVTVNALQTVALDMKLAIGQSVQTVTVSTAPPILETTDATLGAVMDNQMYSSLPLLMGAGGNPDQRRATDFAYLMPGVSQVWVGSGNATDASTSVNGGNPAGGVSEIYIDGVNLPEADGIGDPRFTWTAFGVDAIDQFQVQTSAYSAQFAGQGVQNYSIKQGGNRIHGSLYDYMRNTALDAWGFTSKVPVVTGPGGGTCNYLSAPSSTCAPGGLKPAEHMNEYGLVLSGPILKNKLFLFYNYGGYRYSAGPKPGAQTIPTAAMLGYSQTGTPLGYADFSGFAASVTPNNHIYDPGTQTLSGANYVRTQFPNDQIPGNRISQAAAFINKYMLPYEAETLQNVYSNNIVVGYPSGLSNWYTAGRVDYMMNSRNQLSAIIAFGRQASTGPNSVGASNQLGPPFNTNQSYSPQTTVDILKDTFTINPHIVNQAALAFGRYRSLSVTPDELPQYNVSNSGIIAAAGGALPPGQAQYFPGIKWSGGLDLPSTEADYDENLKVNNTYTAMDNVQWDLGKQNITFGGQVVEVQFNYYKNLTDSSPFTITFANTQTQAFTTGTSLNSSSGSAVASYMLGAVSSSSVSVGLPGLGTRWLDPSFWVQDDYKFTPKLTVNLGVRWDVWPAIHEAHNLITLLDPTGQNAVTGNLGTLAFMGGNSSDGYHTGTQIPSSVWWKNVSPRLGVAYALNGKTVIRGSYGLDFARGDWTSGSQSGSPSTTGLAPSATAAAGTVSAPSYYWDNTQCAAAANDSVPCGWTGSIAPPSATIPTAASPTGGTNLAMFGTSETNVLGTTGAQSLTYWNPYLGSRTPEYINWTLGVERQLTNDMSISISYVGSEGHFISTGSNKAIGSRNNELPESMAALAGYNTSGVACSGAACTTPLLTATNGTNSANPTTNLTTAMGLGFTPPNPYNAADSLPYYKNSVASYYEPFPQYSGMSDTTGFVGNENWNAVELTIRQRPSHGLNWMLNYTYSKSIDDLGTFRVGDNDRLDRSISNGNIPQNLTATVVYGLPVGKGHMWGDNMIYRWVASDWTLSNITSFHSGFPIMITGSGCGGSGILNQCMPNLISGQAGRINGGYGKHITSAPGSPNYFGGIQYINPAAFTVDASGSASNYGTSVSTAANQETFVGNGPSLYVPGNAPRGAALGMYGMGFYDVDLSLRRSFPIYHEWALAFGVDMTNVTNHVVWNSPNAAVNGGSLGELSTIENQPRDVQVSGRISF